MMKPWGGERVTKKLVCIASLTCLLMATIAGSAQGLEKTGDQYQDLEKQYLNEKLIVRPYETLYFYGSNPGLLLPIGSEGWEAYRGGVLLSEEEFYRIMDMPEYAKQARQLKNKKRGLTIGGITACVIGMAIFMNSDPRDSSTAPWLLVGGGGLCLCYAVYLPNKATNSTFAAQNAEIYNKKLRERIFNE